MVIKIFLNHIHIHIAVHHGVDGEGREVVDVELVHDVFAVRHNRGKADTEGVGYLLIGLAVGYVGEYLYLA